MAATVTAMAVAAGEEEVDTRESPCEAKRCTGGGDDGVGRLSCAHRSFGLEPMSVFEVPCLHDDAKMLVEWISYWRRQA